MSFVVASDIGGVIKEMISDVPIENAVESIQFLQSELSSSIIFISKCKSSFQEKIQIWLSQYVFPKVGPIETFFCESYEEKYNLAKNANANVMIDDKLQVFKSFPEDPQLLKIWFTTDYQKIQGAMKYQPEEFNKVVVCNSWPDILDAIKEFKKTCF